MKKIDIVNAETGEYLGTVTTKYNSIEALFENVVKWLRRHGNYRYVTSEELEKAELAWSPDTYYVGEC